MIDCLSWQIIHSYEQVVLCITKMKMPYIIVCNAVKTLYCLENMCTGLGMYLLPEVSYSLRALEHTSCLHFYFSL
uniref:Uncharacterized protein n=1 Tax=Rhizophora mucronata TaxID=61149 RepID=A0A2P2NIN6_RHIMU